MATLSHPWINFILALSVSIWCKIVGVRWEKGIWGELHHSEQSTIWASTLYKHSWSLQPVFYEDTLGDIQRDMNRILAIMDSSFCLFCALLLLSGFFSGFVCSFFTTKRNEKDLEFKTRSIKLSQNTVCTRLNKDVIGWRFVDKPVCWFLAFCVNIASAVFLVPTQEMDLA